MVIGTWFPQNSVSRILDLHEMEARGGRAIVALLAVGIGHEVTQPFDRVPSAGDAHDAADHEAHHVIEKALTLELQAQNVSFLQHTEPRNVADEPHRIFATLRLGYL